MCEVWVNEAELASRQTFYNAERGQSGLIRPDPAVVEHFLTLGGHGIFGRPALACQGDLLDQAVSDETVQPVPSAAWDSNPPRHSRNIGHRRYSFIAWGIVDHGCLPAAVVHGIHPSGRTSMACIGVAMTFAATGVVTLPLGCVATVARRIQTQSPLSRWTNSRWISRPTALTTDISRS
jgi:hypothetical protein